MLGRVVLCILAVCGASSSRASRARPRFGGWGVLLQTDVATGLKGQDPTGLKGKDPTGLKGKDPTGLKGKDPTGLKGKDPTGLKGKGTTGLKGKEHDSHALDRAHVSVSGPTSSSHTSSSLGSSASQATHADLPNPLAPVALVPAPAIGLAHEGETRTPDDVQELREPRSQEHAHARTPASAPLGTEGLGVGKAELTFSFEEPATTDPALIDPMSTDTPLATDALEPTPDTSLAQPLAPCSTAGCEATCVERNCMWANDACGSRKVQTGVLLDTSVPSPARSHATPQDVNANEGVGLGLGRGVEGGVHCVRDEAGNELCRYQGLCYDGIDATSGQPRFYARGRPGEAAQAAQGVMSAVLDDRFWEPDHDQDAPSAMPELANKVTGAECSGAVHAATCDERAGCLWGASDKCEEETVEGLALLQAKKDKRYAGSNGDISMSIKPYDMPIHVTTVPPHIYDDDAQRNALFSHAEVVRSEVNGHVVMVKPSLGQGGNNLCHFTTSVASVLECQLHNDTGVYPGLDSLHVLNENGNLGEWANNTIRMLLPTNATVNLMWDVDKAICFDRAVIYGQREAIFNGPYDAQMFRSRVYSRLGITPRKPAQRATYPLKVLIATRDSSGTRALLNPNVHAIVEGIKAYNGYWWDHYVLGEPAVTGQEMFDFEIMGNLAELSYADQVRLFSNADIIVGVHGAGMTNIIFAHAHTPVIELFPFKFMPPVYRHIASEAGLPYFQVMGKQQVREAYSKPNDYEYANMIHAVDELTESYFHNTQKYLPISLDLPFFLETFNQALEDVPMWESNTSPLAFEPIVPGSMVPILMETPQSIAARVL